MGEIGEVTSSIDFYIRAGYRIAFYKKNSLVYDSRVITILIFVQFDFEILTTEKKILIGFLF